MDTKTRIVIGLKYFDDLKKTMRVKVKFNIEGGG